MRFWSSGGIACQVCRIRLVLVTRLNLTASLQSTHPGGPPTAEQPPVDPTQTIPPATGAYPPPVDTHLQAAAPPSNYPPVPGGPEVRVGPMTRMATDRRSRSPDDGSSVASRSPALLRTRRRCGVGCQREQTPPRHPRPAVRRIADDEFSLANSINGDTDSDAHQVDAAPTPTKTTANPTVSATKSAVQAPASSGAPIGEAQP